MMLQASLTTGLSGERQAANGVAICAQGAAARQTIHLPLGQTEKLNLHVHSCCNLSNFLLFAEKAELLALLAAIGVQPNAGGLKMLRKQLASSANLVLLWKQFRALAVKWPKRWPDRFTPQDPWVTSPTLLDVDRAHANCLDCGAKGLCFVVCEGLFILLLAGSVSFAAGPTVHQRHIPHFSKS